MLFNLQHLEGIKSGNISLAFRRWKKPSVKAGSLIKTAAGVVRIIAIELINLSDISKQDALKAGYSSPDHLLKQLNVYPEGDVFRISLVYDSADPRIALREQTAIPEEEQIEINKTLQRLDKYSRTGPWTQQVLTAIQQNPGLKAADLGVVVGREKEWLKLNVRKLKELGLTISLEPGYRISPGVKKY